MDPPAGSSTSELVDLLDSTSIEGSSLSADVSIRSHAGSDDTGESPPIEAVIDPMNGSRELQPPMLPPVTDQAISAWDTDQATEAKDSDQWTGPIPIARWDRASIVVDDDHALVEAILDPEEDDHGHQTDQVMGSG